MGNALDAAKFSVKQGNTGVGTRKTLLDAVDTGMADVNTWATNIATERKKLKDDTAKLYREGELKAQQEISKLKSTGDQYKTERDLVIKGLASYKDQLYDNEKLVRSGVISADDNVIFRENGKQTFDIMQQKIQSASKDYQLTLQRAKGGYWPDKEGGPDVYHLPASGDEEGAMQRIQSRIMNPNFVNLSIGRNGLGDVTLYKTKLEDGVEVLDLDDNGEPQVLPGQGSTMSILSLEGGRNERADRFDLANETKKFFVKDGALDVAVETMAIGPDGKMYGTVKDFLLARDSEGELINKRVTTLINDATALATSTNSRMVSILTDNGPEGERSKTLTMNEWAMLSDKEKKEKIKYNYYDLETGEVVPGEKNKYLEMKLVANQLTVVLTPEDKKAAVNTAKGSILSKVNEKYTEGGTKRSEFQARQKSAAEIKSEGDDKEFSYTVKLVDQASTGNSESLQALVSESDIVEKYTVIEDPKTKIKTLNFYTYSGDKLADIVFDGLGKSIGTQIASQLKLQAEKYINKTNLKDQKASQKVGDYSSRSREYTNLDDLVFGVNKAGVTTTPSDLFANAGESSAKIKGAFDRTIAEMSRLYGFPEGFLTVEIDSTIGDDRMIIKDASGKEIDKFEDNQSNGANIKNALAKYMKENKDKLGEEDKDGLTDWFTDSAEEGEVKKDVYGNIIK